MKTDFRLLRNIPIYTALTLFRGLRQKKCNKVKDDDECRSRVISHLI
jgi:hypothetical protein